MPKYCDSEVLECNWFEWIVASATPILDPYRNCGKLWTKVIGKVIDKDGKLVTKRGESLDDPGHKVRLHYIEVDRGIFVITNNNKIGISHTDGMHLCSLPYETIPDAFMDAEEFCEADIKAAGYQRERPADESWDNVLQDIYKMCNGIAMRFRMPSEEDRNELANEAAFQVIRKLKTGKLTYIPGRAPVFNLLTTTIHRCMYSALSRDQRRVRNSRAYAEEIKAQHVV